MAVAESASLLDRALGAGIEPPDDATSNRILDAALSETAASGARNLTMDDVAKRAGVGRMTVYRRFGDKERLVQTLAVREARRCLAELDAAAPVDAPIGDQVAEGFVTSLRMAREHPLLVRLARFEPQSVLSALTDEDSAIFATMREFLAARLRASQKAGVLGPVDVNQAAEVLIRLAVSFVLIEESVFPLDDEKKMRAAIAKLAAPLLA